VNKLTHELKVIGNFSNTFQFVLIEFCQIDPLQYGAWTEIATPSDGNTNNPTITTVLLGKTTVFSMSVYYMLIG